VTDAAHDWWRDFFTGVVVDMWLQTMPEEVTRAEVDFLQRMLRVAPPAKILDAPCGGGRHAIPLARAGYIVTGVDFSADFLEAARLRAAEEKLAIAWKQGNMRDIDVQNEYDGAFCFGNSFGYADDQSNAAFLATVFRSLKPGARFVLDYPSVLEARLPDFHERAWMQVGDIYFLEDERYDHTHGHTRTEYTFIREGKVVKRRGSHRNYTFREIIGMLSEAGFADIETFGSLDESPFKLGSQGLYLVAEKSR
jgi:SAM-dependent methyltransferase